MLELILSYAAYAWGFWCLLQVALLLAVPPIAQALGFAATNGIYVVIPPSVMAKLTDAELDAVHAHERGHIHHLHVIENLALACVFLRRTPKRAHQQELEADDYAAEEGHADALASAIEKLSQHPRDLIRVRRLRGLP